MAFPHHTARFWANVRTPVRFGPPRLLVPSWQTVSGPAQPSRGTRARAAIPALKSCLNFGPEDDVMLRLTRLEASEAIWRITGSTLAALTVATEMLDDEFTTYDAVDLLGKLGPAARSAVPDLQRVLEHEDEFLVHKAKRALAKIMAGHDPPH